MIFAGKRRVNRLRLYRVTLWILLTAGVFTAQPVLPQSPGPGSRAEWDKGLDRAVSRAREKTGGRVLSAETREIDGRPTYFVRILTADGKVRRLRTDAATGERLAPRGRR